MPTATFTPEKPSLASRLAHDSYSGQDCTAALKGGSVPRNLGNQVVRLALVAGIRRHLSLAQLPEIQELCDHDAEQRIFARARNARLIMSDEVPEPETDMMRDEDTRPYCIWYPDVPTEQTLRTLVDWYPDMKYHAARACAVGGYYDLYRELDVLPDVSVAEEARENKASGAQQIYEMIMAMPARHRVMDDYALTINPSARPGAQLNADTALVSSLATSRKHSSHFEPWRPFNITEDWGIAEKSSSRKPPTLISEETALLTSPLPYDLPTPNKHLLILHAAYTGSLDRYARLRRPFRVPGEWHCLLRGIYHSTFLAAWLARPENQHILTTVGRHPRDIQALWRAVHARRVMNNDLQHVLELREGGVEFVVPDEVLPYWIWYPTLPHETTLIRLAAARPVMAPQCARACIAANYRSAYLAIMDYEKAPPPDGLMLYEAQQRGSERGGVPCFYESDILRRQEELGIEHLAWDDTKEWRECMPWRDGDASSSEVLGWLSDYQGAVHSGQDGGMWEGNGLETGRLELWASSPEWVRERARGAAGGVLEVQTVPTGGKSYAEGKFA